MQVETPATALMLVLVLVKTRLKAFHGCLPRKVDVHLASLALSLQAVHSNNLKPIL